MRNETPFGLSKNRSEVDGWKQKSCPPHVAILVQAVKEDTYVASYLACALAGPEREDSWESKLAFDKVFGTLPRTQS
jgi:hypothetical protein